MTTAPRRALFFTFHTMPRRYRFEILLTLLIICAIVAASFWF